MNWLCKIFGHTYNPIKLIIQEVKANSENFNGEISIKCERCGYEWIHFNRKNHV